MGTLTCPLCCGETFPSQASLKYHLLSVTDNLYCPECGIRFDSIPLLIQHLNGFCGKDFEETDTSSTILDTFQQPNGNHIVIVQNGDNEINTPPLDEEMSEENELTNSHPPDSRITVCVGQNLKNDDQVDPIQLKITESIEVDQDFNENDEHYTCSICDMTFTGVMEHIKTYHDGQQVIIKIPEGENNKGSMEGVNVEYVRNESNGNDSPLIEIDHLEDELEDEEEDEDTEEDMEKIQDYIETEGLVEFKDKDDEEEDETENAEKSNADIIGTIKQEHCLDQNGIVYERKVVQIQKFWENDDESYKINLKPFNKLEPTINKKSLNNVGRKKKLKEKLFLRV